MSGGLWPRIKTWIAGETVLASDVNAEFDNIKNNLDSTTLDDISSNITEMQQIFDPGDVGTENQPTTLAEENKALRSMVKKITGELVWYIPPGSSLSTLAASIGLTTLSNKLISGKLDGNKQPMVLEADNATLDLALKAEVTNLIYSVNNREYTKSINDTLTILPGYDPTDAINKANFADTENSNGDDSKILGEDDHSIIYITSPGANFAAQKDKICAFITTHAVDGIEYFIGILRQHITTSDYYIEKCSRGFFYDSTQASQRVRLDQSVPQNISVLKLAWIFIKTDGVMTYTFDEPYVDSGTPVGGVGKMWFDTINNRWKMWSGASWVDSESTFLGFSAQSDVACVAVRSQHYYHAFSSLCNIGLASQSEDDMHIHKIRATKIGAEININGTRVNYWGKLLEWDATADMDTGAIAANKRYYFYLDEKFAPKISLIKPYDRQVDMKGFYHPWKPWRCLGHSETNVSTYFSRGIICYGGSSYVSDKSLMTTKMAPYNYLPNGRFAHQVYAALEMDGITSTTTGVIKLRLSGRLYYIGIIPSGMSGSALAGTGGAATIQIQWRSNYQGSWSPWLALWSSSFDFNGVIPCNISKITPGYSGDHEFRAVVSANVTVYGQLVACEI